jgi:hypothetical protein
VATFNEYRLLRVKTSLASPDPDYAGTEPEQTFPPDAELVVLGRPGHTPTGGPVRIKVEIVVEWLDGDDERIGGRGTFDVQAIRVSELRTFSELLVVDSPVLPGQMAYRPIIIDDILVGDRFGVRLSNIDAPAEAEKARVFYREII